MTPKSDIFDKHYQDYLKKIDKINKDRIKEILGLEINGKDICIPFMGEAYKISKDGIFNSEGTTPGYATCVVLAKYILHCPDALHQDKAWVSFKDFKQTAAFTNVNFFSTDTEQAIAKGFSQKIDRLEQACQKAGGIPVSENMPYDLAVAFKILPRLSLLLLFNDQDEEFEAQCKVLFHRHSEFYLDPESLAVTGAVLAKRLLNQTP